MRVCRKILSLPPASFIHSLWAGPAAAVQTADQQLERWVECRMRRMAGILAQAK
eukprot:SAG25_NODE_4019_length_907_cov_0.975248_1_plen_53_part_10